MSDKWRFNSRPSCEGRPELAAFGVAGESFNSRPSCEGRLGICDGMNRDRFQFTPLMRGATATKVEFCLVFGA